MPFPSITQMYEDGWKSIVQPPKLEYSIGDLGSPMFTAGSNIIKRNDFTLTNKRGNTLACSFFENTSSSSPLPCILYLHGNGSFRLEALQYKNAILSQNFHMFCFDFSGCGLSTGEYCSLGHFEQDDIEQGVEHLNQTNKVTKIVLWGRSMGAVAAIMYSAKNPAITCLVLDSAFADFRRLVHEFIKTKTHIPGFIISGALALLRRTIRNKAGFDIYDLQTIEYIKKVQIPVLLGAPKDDTFVSPQHTKDLYNAYTGTKQLSIFEGEHNSQRPFDWIIAAMNFIKSHVNEKTQEVEEIIKPAVSNIKKVEEISDNIEHETTSPEVQITNESHEAKGL